VLGAVVVQRARRADISWTFLAFYLGALAARVVWLGQRWAVWTHHLENGALLLFAFFMISDPKTTPDSRAGRILFALVVALGAGFVQFALFRPNGLIWSLLLCSPITPILNRMFPGGRYQWSSRPAAPLTERSFA